MRSPRGWGRPGDGSAWWGADGPSGPARNPLFVVTHKAPADSPPGGVYTFVTDGIKSALEQAKAVAADKNVTVMGGAETGRQYIAAGCESHQMTG